MFIEPTSSTLVRRSLFVGTLPPILSYSALARLVKFGIGLLCLLFSQSILAQMPARPPWAQSVSDAILQPGIAAVSCGTTELVDADERFTFGLMNVDDVIPDSGRKTVGVQMYHHPSWHVDEIGNVFGVAINERTGDIFLSASSNYGAEFRGQISKLRYGEIGGGASDLKAAGTVYRIDAVTGAASRFAKLPQEESPVIPRDCETGASYPDRKRNTGVGLGNIHYDQMHDQFFVTNIEDGRIYRLGPNGDILDAYDPGLYDTGGPGITSLTDLVYGIAVEPGGDRLFFGGVSTEGMVPLWSIDLSPTGGFVGTMADTGHLDGATWPIYEGDETSHGSVTAAMGPVPRPDTVFHLLSDLEFTPDSRLLVGIRAGCEKSWFTSYNHTGESNVLTKDGFGMYGSSVNEFDVSDDGLYGVEDAYGGVSFYEHADGSVDFVVSSGDIIDEFGPHGLAVFRSADAALSPVSPLAAISYGAVDDLGIGDPKGVGGSVDVFSGDPPCLDPVTFDTLCVVEDGSATGDFTWRFRIKNESGGAIHHLFVNDLPPGVSADPEHIVFDPPIPNGGFSRHADRFTDTITFTGASPGTALDFTISIHDDQLVECCAKKVTIELPECECAQIVSEQHPACFFPAFFIPPPYRYRVDLQNLSDRTAQYILAAAVEPSDVTPPFTPILPEDLRVRGVRRLENPAAPGETTGSVNFLIDGPGANAGRGVCLFLSINDAQFQECCSIRSCFTLPDCRIHLDPFVGPPMPLVGTNLEFEGGELVLSGFGEGVGGIDIEIPGTHVFATTWAPIEPVGVQGVELQVTTLGIEDEELIRAQASERGGMIEIRTVFQQQRDEILVEVLDKGGSVVESQTGRSDRVVVTLETWPAGFVMVENIEGIVILGHEDTYSARLPDGTWVEEAVIRIRDAAGASIGSFGGAALRVEGLDELRLRTLLAFVDCDGDGVPDDQAIAQGLVEDLDGDSVPDSCQEEGTVKFVPDVFDF